MKAVIANVLRIFLCTSLLAGCGLFGRAQDAASQTAAPDNTKTNERDRNQNEPTADQQKENPADRAITQQIRQSLMGDKSLSTYAHNIKIITQNGQVTLKGPVNSATEKQLIEKKATEVAGKDKVTSQLDVKPQQ